jgi:hypothetical protein
MSRYKAVRQRHLYAVEPIVCVAECTSEDRTNGFAESLAALISGLLLWAVLCTY